MIYDWLYKAVMALAILPWVLLIFKPQSQLTPKVLKTYWILFSAIYAFLIISNISLLFRNLSELSELMSVAGHPAIFMAIWVHVLAFDLIAAQWIVTDAQNLAIPHKKIVPALFFTCMLGPVGLLMYFLTRKFFV